MSYRLKKDIVIKAGTIFEEDRSGTVRRLHGDGHLSRIIGLTNDTYGEVLYHLDDSGDMAEEWFERVEE